MSRVMRRVVSFPGVVGALAVVAIASTARGGSDDQSSSSAGTAGVGAVSGLGASGGSSTAGVPGIAGSTGAGACAFRTPATPPTSDGHGLIYHAARNSVLLLTGATRPGTGPAKLYELSLDGGSPTWYRWDQPFGPVPDSRFAPGFAYDYRTDRAVLFGGNADVPQPREVWEWDGCKWLNRTPAWAPTAGWPAPPGGVWPSSRWAPAMTYDWASERVILTTGIQNPTFQWETDPADATVYEWDSAAGVFVVRPPLGQPPTDRGASMAIGDRHRKLVYLITGLQENESPSGGWDTSLYVWNGAAGTWSRRTPTPAPSAREFASLYHDLVADRIVVTGGTWYGWLWTPDYWEYEPEANVFTLLATDPPVYAPTSGFVEMNRFWSPIAYHDLQQVAVQYGGRRASHTNCFFDCAPEMLGDTRLIASGGVPVDVPLPPPGSGSPETGGDPPTTHPPPTNIALNPACPSGFPSPLESDEGWGNGALPCDVVDGQLSYNTWARGLAFTGGHQTGAGGAPYIEPAGVRHAVIDFGAPRTFEKVTIWWHGIEYTPDAGTLEYWNGSAWVGIAPVAREYGARLEDGANSGYAHSDDYSFGPVTGSKFRYAFDNSGHNVIGTWNIHGWIYEIQVWSDGASGSATGQPCSSGDQCSSGFCVDGVCCDGACGGGDPADCQACSVAGGAAADGTCAPVPASRVCRASAGPCDVAESCTGSAPNCPADALAPAGTVCTTECNIVYCAGTTPTCAGEIGDNLCLPPPLGNPAGTACASGSECESGFCTDGVCCATACGDGSANDCQACSVAAGGSEDGTCSPRGIGTVCRERADACDKTETCDGVFFQCPVDAGFPGCAPAAVPECAPPLCGGTTETTVELEGGLGQPNGIEVTFIGPVGSGSIAAVQSDPGNPSGPLPSGYKILSGSTGLYYFDLETTASPASSIEVCVHYNQGTLREGCGYAGAPPMPSELLIRLVHDDGIKTCNGSPFCNITMTQDPCANTICGLTSSLSPFAILFITGYPPEDLVLKPALQADAMAPSRRWRRKRPAAPRCSSARRGSRTANLYNAFALLDGGAVKALRYKVDLPNYGVFDEKRVFTPGPLPGTDQHPRRAHRRADLRGHLERRRRRMHHRDRRRVPAGAERLAVRSRQGRHAAQHRRRPRRRERAAARLSQSDRRPGRAGVRRRLVRAQCRSPPRGADAELGRGARASRAGGATTAHGSASRGERGRRDELEAAIYRAMMLGLGDYVHKNRFPGVVLGLSGGIDSALTAAVAVDALGAGTRALRDDAVALYLARTVSTTRRESRRLLGTQLDTIPIESAVKAFGAMLAGASRARRPTRRRRTSSRASAA